MQKIDTIFKEAKKILNTFEKVIVSDTYIEASSTVDYIAKLRVLAEEKILTKEIKQKTIF